MSGAKDAGKDSAAPATKHRRTGAQATAADSAEPGVSMDEGAWGALADVYMELGEDHLAHVAYASRIARWGVHISSAHFINNSISQRTCFGTSVSPLHAEQCTIPSETGCHDEMRAGAICLLACAPANAGCRIPGSTAVKLEICLPL